LIKELDSDNSLCNSIHTPAILAKEEILDNHRFFVCVPLEFQQNMTSWIIRHSTGFLNYTGALTSSVILLDLPNVPRACGQIIDIYSISGQNRASALLWQKKLTEWCESDVDSEKKVNIFTIKASYFVEIPKEHKQNIYDYPEFPLSQVSPGYVWSCKVNCHCLIPLSSSLCYVTGTTLYFHGGEAGV
jgi:hypothetical protein